MLTGETAFSILARGEFATPGGSVWQVHFHQSPTCSTRRDTRWDCTTTGGWSFAGHALPPSLGLGSRRPRPPRTGRRRQFVDYFPGTEYVDILSLDCYQEFKQSYCDDLMKLAAGKPMTLAEVGGPPSLAVLEKQPGWTRYMPCAGMGGGGFGRGSGQSPLVSDPRMFSLEDAGYRQAIAPIREAAGLPPLEPVDKEKPAAEGQP
jgi:hypothetical protein